MIVKRKRIYLTKQKKKYCIVRLYKEKTEMQQAYKEFGRDDCNILGAHCAYWHYNEHGLTPETGRIYLSFSHCGAGIIAHELLHAVLWAYKHTARKKQYPFVIKNMKEEESILHNLTFALIQFYKWYWKIEKEFKL